MSIALIGCSSPRTLADWQGKQSSVEVVEAEPPCVWPDLEREGDRFYMDADGFRQQKDCQAAEQGNHKIAGANAESVRELQSELNTVNEIGQRQRDMAEFQINELDRDRRDANLEAWTYKGVLALVLIAVAL